MKFAEKLKLLTKGHKLSSVAEDATINAGLLNNYINRGSEPGAVTALKIAKALHVPVEWLIDDAAGLPIPQQTQLKPALEDSSPHDLKVEIAKRHRREVIRTLEALNLAERMIAQKSYEVPPVEARRLLLDLNPIYQFADLSPDTFANENHAMMPGHERPLADFYGQVIAERFCRVAADPGIREVRKRALSMLPASQIPNPMPADIFELLTGKSAGVFVGSVGLDAAEIERLQKQPPGAEVPGASKPVRKPSKPQ